MEVEVKVTENGFVHAEARGENKDVNFLADIVSKDSSNTYSIYLDGNYLMTLQYNRGLKQWDANIFGYSEAAQIRVQVPKRFVNQVEKKAKEANILEK